MSSEDRQPIRLTLRRIGDLIAADLAETSALIPRSEVHVDDAFLAELVEEMEHLAARRGSSGATGVEPALARIGGLIFSHLLTEPVRRCLRDTPPADLYLRLDERLVHVPWELCHDGSDFLAAKFRVGRQVITAQPIPDPPRPRASRDTLRVLLVADPTETLPHAAAEAEQLCALLDAVPGVAVTLLAGRGVRRVPLLAALQEHDVVHFAGHSHYDRSEPTRSGWRLAEGSLSAAELAKLRPPPFLVFSNSCEASASDAWSGPSYEPHAFGIGSAFLLAGVPNYVGTFWVVHDGESIDFALACYRALVTGARLGDALHEARDAVIATHGREGLTWISYTLYGDPALQPLAGAQTVPAAALPRPLPARESHRFEVSLSGPLHRGAAQVGRVVDGARVFGRDAELERLESALDAARRGQRGVVFVSGPPGIGKTTLVEAFLARARAAGDAWVAQGQAVEQYGIGEAYLPLLEAWGRLARDSDGRMLLPLLRQHAPTWLAQLTALLTPAEREALLRSAQGSTRERMLREMAELFEAITAERPLLLLLEDLHWSDRSTLELIAYLAQRREPARLLVVGTYRPVEAMAGEHPLRAIVQELRARRQSDEVRLEPLAEKHVGQWLRGRLDSADIDEQIARAIHLRTEGHPLFFVSVVDFALREGLLHDRDGRWTLRDDGALTARIPESLRPMIERQIEALTADEQSLLEAAAVAGAEFSIAEVAAALESDPEAIDDRCEALAWRGQLLRSIGVDEWPDGTVGGRYRFSHSLYQNALYDRVAAARRVRLHRRIGERKEQAFGSHAPEIAGELAAHFEAARDHLRAVEYRTRAGEVAVRRSADREAIQHFRHALDLLPRLGKTPERDALELGLLVKLATPLMSTSGYAAREVGEVFERAHALARQINAGPHLAPLLRGLVSFYQVRGRNLEAREVGLELLALCAREGDPIAQVQADYGHGVTLYDLLELDSAQSHFERALAAYRPETHPAHAEIFGGYDPGVGCLVWLGWTAWLKGEPDRAIHRGEEAIVLAERLGHRFSLTFAYFAAAMIHLYRGEVALAVPHLTHARDIASDDGFAYLRAITTGMLGWVAMVQGRMHEALALAEESIAAQRATGAEGALSGYLRLLIYIKASLGDLEEARELSRTALEMAERNNDLLFLGQLLRTRAELLSAAGDAASLAEAESCHRRDIALAAEHGVPMFELQAALGLARFLIQRDRRSEVQAILAPVCERFAANTEIRALIEARQILAAT